MVGLEVAAADKAASEDPFLRRGPGGGREAEAVLVAGVDDNAGQGAEEEFADAAADWVRYLTASGCERGSKRVVV